MKKILMNTGYILLTIYVVMLAACADLNDIQQEYIDRGERIYTGKAESLTVNGGLHRLQVTGTMQYAKAAEYCMLRWTNGTDTDSLKVPASNWQATDTMKVILNGLNEGAYRIFVQTYDKEGNSSLNVECNGNVYGESFILSANANIISQIKFLMPSVIELSWAVSEKAESVEVVYESKTGNKTLFLPGNTATTELSDWKIGGEIKSRTAIIPEAGAIDMIYTNWLVQSFPADDILDKTKITPLYLANDAIPAYGGNAANLFNDVFSERTGGSQFASDFGIPNHLTFDLGVFAHLKRFEFWPSDTDDVWDPTAIQFWGIADVTGAEITEPRTNNGDGGAAWEAEALAKGWVKLVEGRCTSFSGVNEFISDNPAKIRYLIVRITEVQNVTGSSKIVKISEVTLYSDDITEL